MESLTNSSPDTVTESDTKVKSKQIDRVTLGKAEADKVTAWLAQLEDCSKGFLQLTKSDLTNFLIRKHHDELTKKEITQIRQYHYDPIKHLNWIAPQIKAALSKGDMARVAELQSELRGVELSVAQHDDGTIASVTAGDPQASQKFRKKRIKKNDDDVVL